MASCNDSTSIALSRHAIASNLLQRDAVVGRQTQAGTRAGNLSLPIRVILATRPPAETLPQTLGSGADALDGFKDIDQVLVGVLQPARLCGDASDGR